MIDRKQLDSHPANRLAGECLRAFKAAPDSQQINLLTLVQVYLNQLPATALRQGYTDDLRQAAYQVGGDPAWVASLFVEDRESLLEELPEQPDQEWPVLKAHLDGLYQAMRKEKGAQAVGNLLAHLLFDNLQVVQPGFGPASQ